MLTDPKGATADKRPRSRDDIAPEYRWDLTHIFPDWAAWEQAYQRFEQGIAQYAALQGTLGQGGARLLEALRLDDELGQLAFRLWYFAALCYDQDQRDNTVNARRQQVEILFARQQQESAWFKPELLQIPLETVRGWMAADGDLAVYRFALEDLYRQQEHVLDQQGERLLSLSARLSGSPHDSYSALSTADAKFPTLTLADGSEVVLTYGQYRAILATNRNQADRAAAFRGLHELYATSLNTYAALYNAVLQRDWFHAQARGYRTTLDAALHGDNIPPSVVENLIETTKAGTEPLRRYHRLRRRVLGLPSYHVYDNLVPLLDVDRRYPYPDVQTLLVDSVAPLGPRYQERMREALEGRWIDVYENPGKRSGAYSAPVYGVHPYMLLNYNDTLDAVFTLAHEMGHSMHTLLSHAHQPFVYASYTIFVAEVPSTLSEELFLEHMLSRTSDERERIVLLQHAIDGIVGTFYTQVLFADYELQAHRLVEAGQPITADVLGEIYWNLLQAYYGDALDYDDLARVTWARIPHFFSTPYYVYQYATCFASTAQLVRQITRGDAATRAGAVERYLTLLKAGGSDYPMTLLQRAGVDLSRPEPVRAVVDQLDRLVTQLEEALAKAGR
ncbi:MAG: oligoendopeptidase F [Acidobacteriota bacterium]|nr:oligoendopeptidase F [Acidobacteriota bacterium]